MKMCIRDRYHSPLSDYNSGKRKNQENRKKKYNFLIIGFIIESSVDKVCFYNVYKCLRIHFRNFFHKDLCFVPGHYRIDHCRIVAAVAAGTVDSCGRVMGQLGNFFIDFIRMPCNNKQRDVYKRQEQQHLQL